MRTKLFIFFGFFLLQTEATSGIEYTQISLTPNDTEYTKSTDEGLIVICAGDDVDKLKWTKVGGLDVNNERDVNGQVYVVKSEKELRLIFSKVKLEDKGVWNCTLKGNEYEEGKSFNLKVYSPLVIRENRTELLYVKEGHQAFIRCEVTGSPEPKISWLFNGVNIKDLETEKNKYTIEDGLSIRDVSQNEAGEYTCKASQISDEISDTQERIVKLIVEFKPKMYGHPHRNRYAYLDGEVNLTCDADANPSADYFWFRDGKRIYNNVFSEENFSVLRIFVKSKDVFGEYKCKARNSLGEKSQTTLLQEGTKPDRPKTFFLRGLSSDTFDIDVGAKKDPKSTNLMDINGFKFELIPKEIYKKNNNSWGEALRKEFAVADGVTYLISQLSADTIYMVRVASRNLAGFSDWSETKEFSTLLKQPYVTSSGTSLLHSSLVLIKIVAIYVTLRV